MEFGVLGEHHQLFVQHLEALFRHLVRLHIVYGNLHVVEAGLVQPLDPGFIQEVAVGNHSGYRPGLPPQVVDAPEHLVERHRLADLVVLVAVPATQIAEPRRHNLHQNRVSRMQQRAGHHPQLAHLPRNRYPPPTQRLFPRNCHLFH